MLIRRWGLTSNCLKKRLLSATVAIGKGWVGEPACMLRAAVVEVTAQEVQQTLADANQLGKEHGTFCLNPILRRSCMLLVRCNASFVGKLCQRLASHPPWCAGCREGIVERQQKSLKVVVLRKLTAAGVCVLVVIRIRVCPCAHFES